MANEQIYIIFKGYLMNFSPEKSNFIIYETTKNHKIIHLMAKTKTRTTATEKILPDTIIARTITTATTTFKRVAKMTDLEYLELRKELYKRFGSYAFESRQTYNYLCEKFGVAEFKQ